MTHILLGLITVAGKPSSTAVERQRNHPPKSTASRSAPLLPPTRQVSSVSDLVELEHAARAVGCASVGEPHASTERVAAEGRCMELSHARRLPAVRYGVWARARDPTREHADTATRAHRHTSTRASSFRLPNLGLNHTQKCNVWEAVIRVGGHRAAADDVVVACSSLATVAAACPRRVLARYRGSMQPAGGCL